MSSLIQPVTSSISIFYEKYACFTHQIAFDLNRWWWFNFDLGIFPLTISFFGVLLVDITIQCIQCIQCIRCYVSCTFIKMHINKEIGLHWLKCQAKTMVMTVTQKRANRLTAICNSWLTIFGDSWIKNPDIDVKLNYRFWCNERTHKSYYASLFPVLFAFPLTFGLSSGLEFEKPFEYFVFYRRKKRNRVLRLSLSCIESKRNDDFNWRWIFSMKIQTGNFFWNRRARVTINIFSGCTVLSPAGIEQK